LIDVATPNGTTGWVVGTLGTIRKTTNTGISWSTQTHTAGNNDLRSVHFPNDANTGWVCGNSGTILKTTNGGAQWTLFSSGTVQTLRSVFFTNINTGWVVGNGGTILKTQNGGSTWSPLTSGITDNLYSVSFANIMTGWACGDNGKILFTGNGGTNWVQQNSGTTGGLTSVQFIYPDTSKGWICGNNGRILKTGNGGVTSLYQAGFKIPEGFSISQNFPNPFNPSTLIKFEIPSESNVRIEIFDIAGKKVDELVNSRLKAGIYNSVWDAGGFSSGTYFYTVIAGNFTATKKMILIK
jgi:photosystem II stability/assembly factor-like uncharacterized protein